MLKPLLAVALLLSGLPAFAADTPLTAARYARQLGVGMDVDWARTDRGIREFDPLVARDFYAEGIRHVRIRVADTMTEARLIHLRKLVEACEQNGLIPIISYQADAFKADPSVKNEAQLVAWWTTVATYFGTGYPQLGFDLIYDPADKLNRDQSVLNRAYDNIIRTVHDINAQRMIFIAPRLRAAPEELNTLKLPPHSQNYLLAEWHIFPWGPMKNSGKYPWTSGTAAEKAAIRMRINMAVRWQQKTGHATWVGGWSVGETIKNAPAESQLTFATFMACELNKAQIPYAINTDTQFYDGEEGDWRPTTEPLLKLMIAPECEATEAKPGHRNTRLSAHSAPDAAPAAASSTESAPPRTSSASRG